METEMNAISATDTALPVKTISDLQVDACMLHGFAQGLAELHDMIKTDLSPASNAMPPMFASLIERADRLANDLDALNTAQRAAARGGRA